MRKDLEGFGPDVEGFDQLPFADLDAVKKAIGPETAAILIEPIQGEGGVRVAPTPFLRGLRELCNQHDLLLVFDEVQTGIGRTGSFFAYQRCGVAPDVMGIAKAIGGGFPLGACLATAEAGKGMTAGTHGSTFGANPLAMAVGNAVLDVVLAPGFLEAMRAERLLAAAAGDNVVRMLPPLIIEEPDIADAISRIDRAAGRIERMQREKQQAGREAAKVNS